MSTHSHTEITVDVTAEAAAFPPEGSPEYRALTAEIIAEFRARGGEVGGPLEGVPLILLTTTGAKSGQPRTVPAGYSLDGERLLLVAAKEGDATRHPDWFYNLRANPDVTVELGREMFPARATILTGDERQRLFDRIYQEIPPAFTSYLDKTHIEVPVIAIERKS